MKFKTWTALLLAAVIVSPAQSTQAKDNRANFTTDFSSLLYPQSMWVKTLSDTLETTTEEAETCTITYVAINPDTGELIEKYSLEKVVNYEDFAPSIGTPTTEGYTFEGWFYEDSQGKELQWVFNKNTVDSDLTLTAQWSKSASTVENTIEEPDAVNYKFVFDTQGGTVIEDVTVANGDTVSEPTNPTKAGYLFKGWYTTTDYDTPFSFKTPITGDTTIYAEWEADTSTPTTFTLTFNSNSGSSVTAQTITKGSLATQPSNPTRSGYTFVNWYSDSALTKVFDFKTAITANTTIYAKWSENIVSPSGYTVTFHTDGGTSINSQIVTSGNTVDEPSKDPTKTGYYFAGWYSSSQCSDGDEWNFNTDTITSTTTIYAKWVAEAVQTYTVRFISNDSTYSSYTVNSNSLVEEPTEPTRRGYTFQGWYADVNYADPWDFNNDRVNETTYIYAKWDEIVYRSATGQVVQYWGTSVPNATVSLHQKNTLIQQTTTDETGHYTFHNLSAGLYNVKISTTEVTAYDVISIQAEEEESITTLTLPFHYVSTGMTIGYSTPVLIVDGLDTIAESIAYSLKDETDVSVQLSISAGTDADRQEILDVKSGSDGIASVFNVTLGKTTSNYFTQDLEVLTEIDSFLEIIIEIPSMYRNMDYYSVYREHDGEYDILTTSANRDGERILINESGTALCIYTKKFSTYALMFSDKEWYSTETKFDVGVEMTLDGEKANALSTVMGTLELSTAKPYYDSEVTVTINVNKGFELDTLSLRDEEGETVIMSKISDGTYEFTQPNSNVILSIGYVTDTTPVLPTYSLFNDVSIYDSYCVAVNEVTLAGYMDGTGFNTFSPHSTVTRGMMVQILYNLSGQYANYPDSSFVDIYPTDWYSAAVGWAEMSGVITGYSDGTFRPHQNITREEMSMMFHSFGLKFTTIGNLLWLFPAQFTDSGSITYFAQNAINWCYNLNMVSAQYNNLFRPHAEATRAELAVAIHALLQEIEQRTI